MLLFNINEIINYANKQGADVERDIIKIKKAYLSTYHKARMFKCFAMYDNAMAELDKYAQQIHDITELGNFIYNNTPCEYDVHEWVHEARTLESWRATAEERIAYRLLINTKNK